MTQQPLIKVLLADDHEIYLDGLQAMLQKQPDVEVVIRANSLILHGRNLEELTLTFKIFFYKAMVIWQLQNFKFDNKIDEEIEEASKAYRFKENLMDPIN